MGEYEIHFRDLTPEAQKALLRRMGLKSEREANWDVFPIAEVPSATLS